MASAATHAVLPKLATARGPPPPGRRRAALAPAALRRRRRLLAARVRLRPGPRGRAGRARDRLHLPRPERAGRRRRRAGAARAPRRPGRASRSTGRRSSWSGRTAGYPSDRAYLEYHRLSDERHRGCGRSRATRMTARRRARARLSMRAHSWRAVRERLERARASGRAAGASACSRSTPSCSGTGGRRARAGWAEVLAAAERSGRPPADAARGAGRARARAAPGRRVELGRGQDARDLGLARGRGPGLGRPAAGAAAAAGAGRAGASRRRGQRAARELLAVQSSDWAFMDHRGQAGDYPYRRATATRRRCWRP